MDLLKFFSASLYPGKSGNGQGKPESESTPEPEIVDEPKVKDEPMSEESCGCGPQGGDRCEKPNYCNDLAYLFGDNRGCRAVDHPLQTVGGTGIGYAINKGTLKEVKINWAGKSEANEVITVQKNGCDIAWVKIEGKAGHKCVEVKEDFCDCDIINVVSRISGSAPDKCPEEWIPAGCITVALWYTPHCNVKPPKPGIAEYYLSISAPLPTVWSTVNFDTLRVNTMPAEVAYAGGVITLMKPGVYKVDYSATLETYTSTSLNVRTRLSCDTGSGYVPYPSSESSNYILAGAGGTATNTQGVLIVVPHGGITNVIFEGQVDVDSSTNGTVDANIIIHKVV